MIGISVMLTLSIIIPFFNEDENILKLLDEVKSSLGDNPEYLEVLAINDGSTDSTEKILHECQENYPALRIISFKENAGQSAAMVCGFLNAKGRYVVTLDGDGQNDPADIPGILKMLDEYEVVCGIRKNRKDSISKRWGSKLANRIRRKVTHDSIIDIGCSLKGFHREPLEALIFFNGVHRFLPILLEMEGCSIAQVEVNHRPRINGVSKYTNWGRLLKTWQDLLGVRWLQARKLSYKIKE